jgi:hypothetical protein
MVPRVRVPAPDPDERADVVVANVDHLLVFSGFVVGIPAGMNKLTRLRHAERRIVKVQRRFWLAQALAWPTVIAAGATSVGVLVWFLRRRSPGNRHEMPDLPGSHEDGTVRVEPDGQLTHTLAADDALDTRG